MIIVIISIDNADVLMVKGAAATGNNRFPTNNVKAFIITHHPQPAALPRTMPSSDERGLCAASVTS